MTPILLPPRLLNISLGLLLAVPLARAQMAPPPPVQQTGAAARAAINPVYQNTYRIPTVAEITGVLDRVRGYMEIATPGRLVDGTGQEITDFTQPVAGATSERGGAIVFPLLTYEEGVVFIGMLNAADATGNTQYDDYIVKRLNVMANYLKVAPASSAAVPGVRGARGGAGLVGLKTPNSLDTCGALCASLLKAHLANVGPDLSAVTNTWMDFMANKDKVPRLADGTIARHVPMPDTIWADDMYMSVPALAWMGKTTGDKKYFDDAVKQVTQMSARLFQPELGIYRHGWITTNPDPVDIHWARANGWCMMAMCELLDALPKDYPERNTILNLYRAHVRGIASRQSADGLWHQLLDREDSYLETSASAMFVYAFAHGVNQGWISPAFGAEAITGWNAVAARVNDKGQVEGTCVGTSFELNVPYYYYRPTSVDALHGYGPTLLAGSEIIKLLKNPNITVALSGGLYVSPKLGQPMPWMEEGRPPTK
ncbi:MAG TPA: glycoside hydrolase family 88 protein [Opitutales bacterium]|jgi:unsaturated rhamnogalacturonyl hydrolase|nr:glycoside hydrolase family 88 protein [Opitutales bacterium]